MSWVSLFRETFGDGAPAESSAGRVPRANAATNSDETRRLPGATTSLVLFFFSTHLVFSLILSPESTSC